MIKGGRQLLWVGLLRKGVSEVVTLVENEWSEEAGKGEIFWAAEMANCEESKAKIRLPAWYIKKYKVSMVEQSNQKK